MSGIKRGQWVQILWHFIACIVVLLILTFVSFVMLSRQELPRDLAKIFLAAPIVYCSSFLVGLICLRRIDRWLLSLIIPFISFVVFFAMHQISKTVLISVDLAIPWTLSSVLGFLMCYDSILLFWGIAVAGRWSIPGIRHIRMPWRRLCETLFIYFGPAVIIGRFVVLCVMGSYYYKTWHREQDLLLQVLKRLFWFPSPVVMLIAAPYVAAFCLSLVGQKRRPGLAWLMVPYAALFIIVPFALYDWFQYWPEFPDLEDLSDILYFASPLLLIHGFATVLSARTIVQWRKEVTANSPPA
jgi:hypothetical protein